MRKVIFGGGNSLDNFIARENHGTDRLSWSDEVASFTAEFWQTIDTVLMGRKTYEAALKSGTSSYPGVKNYVFWRTMKSSPDQRVEIISADVGEFVRRLKDGNGKGICVIGSGELAHSLF